MDALTCIPVPQPRMTPRETFQLRNSKAIRAVPLSEAAGCIVANSIIPYPPGIPLLMPGETMGDEVSLLVSTWHVRVP